MMPAVFECQRLILDRQAVEDDPFAQGADPFFEEPAGERDPFESQHPSDGPVADGPELMARR